MGNLIKVLSIISKKDSKIYIYKKPKEEKGESGIYIRLERTNLSEELIKQFKKQKGIINDDTVSHTILLSEEACHSLHALLGKAIDMNFEIK